MIGPPISADQKVYQSEPASLSHAKKEARPTTKGLTRAERKELETEGAKRNALSEKGSPEWTTATFPLAAGVLETAGTTEAGGKTNDQNQPSIQALSHAKPKVTLQRVTTPQSHASDATSPKRELAEDVTGSEGGQCHPSETEGLLVGSVEPVLSDQGRKYSSTQHNAKPATSASLKLDTVDPQRQKLLAKLLDVPVSDCHSPKNNNHGVPRGRPLILNKESSSRDGDHVSEVSPYPGNTEAPKKSESLLLDLHPAPLGKTLVGKHQELDLGIELCQRKGNPENSSMSATEVLKQACSDRDNKDPILPAKAKTQAALAHLNVLTLPEGTSRKLLSVPESGHQHLTSPAEKSPENSAKFYGQNQVPAITLLVGNKREVLEPMSFCQPHAPQTGYQVLSCSARYPVSKSSLISHVATADSEALPRSVGLEWFPELYPGYVGLGVLPRGPQHWNSVAQMPPPATSQGASVSEVPRLGRSSADSWSSGAPAHTTSSFPLRLLGAVHKGWVRCNTTIKKSNIGGLTMLFAGYFILCCNWSFKHLKLQRWRK